MKKMFSWSLLATLMAFGTFTNLNAATGYGTSEGPRNWGPWYLFKSNLSTYVIECVYKRKELEPTKGSSSTGYIMSETRSVQIARYPFGRCTDTITF